MMSVISQAMLKTRMTHNLITREGGMLITRMIKCKIQPIKRIYHHFLGQKLNKVGSLI
jgi:hypothetical protein